MSQSEIQISIFDESGRMMYEERLDQLNLGYQRQWSAFTIKLNISKVAGRYTYSKASACRSKNQK